jgi:AP-3 complex subunit delta-1
VVLLTTNLLKKELRGAVGGGMHGVYEAGLAINCISNIVTEDLARDLLPELTNLTTHPQPYLRKKALLCLFKLFVKYPQGLRLTFARLQQSLDDPNQSVVSCAVNVITELSDKNPKNYLHLAPQFFKVLTHSSNNWMLIKVVKLLGSLVSEEPRLARKLLEPLAGIVRSTQAKSLLYESVRTITLCLPYCRKENGTMPQNVPAIVELCADTLFDFVQQTDQNLKYLGLVGFGSLMQSHPRVLSDPKYRPLILACLSDPDVTIRRRALDLLTAMTSRKNLAELVSQLMKHVELAAGAYKLDLVAKIVEMCSGDKYALLHDFAWYLDVLLQLGHMRGIERHGELLQSQVTEIALRVLPIRPYAVRRSIEILLEEDGDLSDDPYGDNGRGKRLMPQILPAIAWIIGEYSDLIPDALSIDPDEKNVEFLFDESSAGTYHAIIQCLAAPANLQMLPSSTQKVYIQASLKVFAAASTLKTVKARELEACVDTIHSYFPAFMQSTDVEVVERSFTAVELLTTLRLCSPSSLGINWDVVESSSSEKEEDLLGMSKSGGVDPKKAVVSRESTSKSLATKVRESSETLVLLFKPAPMKPSGAKLQRKKHQSTLEKVDLQSPVNHALFRDMVKEENDFRSSSKMSLESVCFTQQNVLLVEEKFPMQPKINIDSVMSGSLQLNDGRDAAVSFQHPNGDGAVFRPPRQRQGDPFYLDSTPTTDAQGASNNPTRFDTIQLLDSDGEDGNGLATRKKKKEKKVKKQLTKADEWLPTNEAANIAVYESEDEDDENPHHRRGRQKRSGTEFAGLAKVDLTTPLREDEVMPERKHRVVPDRALTQQAAKKEKKKKKSKKRVPNGSDKEEPNGFVGDLLDLGEAFVSNDQAAAPSSSLSVPQRNTQSSSSVDLISSAFDGLLLDLSAQVPVPQLGGDFMNTTMNQDGPLITKERQKTHSGTSNKRPWLKASVKGSSGAVDWTRIAVLFRVYRSSEGSIVGSKLVVRICNNSSSFISDLILEVEENSNIQCGSLAPLASFESGKLGPFLYSTVDAPRDVKCYLRTGESKAAVKLHLPVTLQLNPESRVSIEQVARELSSSGWASSSAKVDTGCLHGPDDVIATLAAFLRAANVHDEGTSTSATATLAARSVQGKPVRFLVKVKDSSTKVDIRTTDEFFCKAIASDLKRLVLSQV